MGGAGACARREGRALPRSVRYLPTCAHFAVSVDDKQLSCLSRDPSAMTALHVPPLSSEVEAETSAISEEGNGQPAGAVSETKESACHPSAGEKVSISSRSGGGSSSSGRGSNSSSSSSSSSVIQPAPRPPTVVREKAAKRPRAVSRNSLPSCVTYCDPSLSEEALSALVTTGCEVVDAVRELYDVELQLRLIAVIGAGGAGGGSTQSDRSTSTSTAPVTGRIEFSFEAEPSGGASKSGPSSGTARADMTAGLIRRMVLSPTGATQQFLETFSVTRAGAGLAAHASASDRVEK